MAITIILVKMLWLFGCSYFIYDDVYEVFMVVIQVLLRLL